MLVKDIYEYSQHLKTQNRTVRFSNAHFLTQFVSGFQMVGHLVLAAILLKPFKNPTKKSGFRMVLSKTGPFDNQTKIEFENLTRSSIQMFTVTTKLTLFFKT